MKNIIGTVEKIENGSFNLRTSNGKIIPLHEGHKIYNGESILGKDENSLIGIKLSNKETITLNGTTEQLFDNSLLNKIDNEELAFNQKVVKDVTSIETASREDKTNVETATGNENQDSTSFKAVFDARDGNSVDIESDLREGTLNQDVNYYQYEQLDASLLNPQAELEPVTPLPVEPTPPPVPPVKPEEPEIPLNAELKAKNDTVIEGENITITVTLDNPSKNDLIITLSNDEIITIKAGETEGSVTFENPYNDDKYVQGDRNLDFSIKNVTGDNIENLPTVTITVKDDQDVTKITLTGSIVTEGEEHTITATVDNAPKSDLVITLSNGKTITILAGEFEGSVTYNSRADDVYLQGEESNSISIASTIGGDYEAIDYENSNVKVTVSDGDNSNVTTTTISITSTENINYAITDTTAELTTDRTDKPGTSYVSGNLDVLDPNEKYLDGFYAKEDGYLPVNSNETYEVNGKEYIKYKGKEYLVPSITAEDIEIKEFYIKDGLVKLDENGKAYSESILVLEHPAKYDMEFRFGSTQDIYMIKVGETTSNPIKQYAINNGADDVYTSSGGSGTHLWLSKVDGEEILLRTYENKNDVFNISEANTVLPNTVTVMFKEDSNIDTTNVNISTQIVDDNAIFTIQTSNPPKTGTIANATIQINGLIYSVTLDATGKGTLTLSIDIKNI